MNAIGKLTCHCSNSHRRLDCLKCGLPASQLYCSLTSLVGVCLVYALAA